MAANIATARFELRDKALAIDPLQNALVGKGNALDGLGKHTQAEALAIDPNYKVALKGESIAVSDFSNNPREIKRFVNVLRFHRYIWYGMNIRTAKEPCSFDQMAAMGCTFNEVA